jgi:hypothetical protein
MCARGQGEVIFMDSYSIFDQSASQKSIDMKCNIPMTSFVNKTLKKSHSELVERLVAKAQINDTAKNSRSLEETSHPISQIDSLYTNSDYGVRNTNTASPSSTHQVFCPDFRKTQQVLASSTTTVVRD